MRGDRRSCDTGRLLERKHEIMVWDQRQHTGQNLASFTGTGLIVSAAFGPDKRWLAVGSGKGHTSWISDWTRDNGQSSNAPKRQLTGHRGLVAALAFSGNGRWLASAGIEDRMVKIWDLQDDQTKVHTLTAPPLLCDLAFTPDNKRLAGISRDLVKIRVSKRTRKS